MFESKASGDCGASVAFVAVVFGVVGLAGSLVAVGVAAQLRVSQSQWAADATALAAAQLLSAEEIAAGSGPVRPDARARVAARRVAAANGAELRTLRLVWPVEGHRFRRGSAALPVSPTVVVLVQRQGLQSSAAATVVAAVSPP